MITRKELHEVLRNELDSFAKKSDAATMIDYKEPSDLPNTYPKGITTFYANQSRTTIWRQSVGLSPALLTRALITTSRGGDSLGLVQRLTIFGESSTILHLFERASYDLTTWGVWERIISENRIASESTLGLVKVDNQTIFVTGDGAITTLSEQKKTLLYLQGNEVSAITGNFVWVAAGSGTSRAKEIDHLFLRATQPGTTVKWVTNNAINLNRVNKLKIELEGITGGTGTAATIRLVLHTTRDSVDIAGTAALILQDLTIPRGVYELDTSTINGDYFISILVRNASTSTGDTICRAYRVWGE